MRTNGRWFSLLLAGVLAFSSGMASADARRSRPGRAGGSASGPTAVSGSARPAPGHGHYVRPWGGWYGGHPYHHGFYGAWAWSYWPYWAYGPYGWSSGAVVRPGERRALPAVVETDVRPKRAEIFVDGEFVGQARDFNGSWDLLTLEPGDRTVELRHPGYRTLRIGMRLRGGEYVRIDERLERGEGLDARSSEAPPTAVAVAEASPSPEEPRLRQGLLHIAASPSDAAVYLDGEYLANAGELGRLHGAIPVAAGEHTVEVVRPGYAGRSMRVTVGAEDPVRVEVDLERER